MIRRLGTMAKEVKVEPYSMAFVTAPDNEVAKKLAGGLGKITPHSLTNTSARLSRKLSFRVSSGSIDYSASSSIRHLYRAS